MYQENNEPVCLALEHHTETTNNRMEFMAIIKAIEIAKSILKEAEYEGAPLSFDSAEIMSDSNYCVQTIQKWMYSWAAKRWRKSDKRTPENIDLVQRAYELMRFESRITIKKVKGHNGDPLNEYADKCAVYAKKEML